MRVLVSGTTKTMKRIAKKRADYLGVLVTPNSGNSLDSILALGLPWAADNGAFSGFDELGFRRFLMRLTGNPGCLFVVCPDVVGDAAATINLFGEWHETVAATGLPVAFVIQDGQEDLEMPFADAYFIGGTTEFKLSEAAATCAEEGHWRGGHIHMGRVNSLRRMRIARTMFVDSIDGSSLSMFGDAHIEKFCRWASQLDEQPTFF